MSGRSVNLTTLFLGRLRPPKRLTSGQSDYPRTRQDTPGHPRTLQDSIICMFNILYERVDDGLVLVCCIGVGRGGGPGGARPPQ